MAEKQSSLLTSALKLIVLLGLMVPGVFWLDEKVGPGYSIEVQNKLIAVLGSKAEPETEAEPAPAAADTPAPEAAKKDEEAATKPKETQAKTDKTVTKVRGIDVSHYQGVIDWTVLGKSNLGFVFVKATGGNTYTDPHFHTNWHALRSQNMARGAYHFFYAADDGKTQAENFLKTLGKLKPTDLPPVLDVEIADHTDAKALLEGVLTWLETVEEQTKRRPIIYTGVSFGQQYLSDPKLAKYPLWIADYGKKIEAIPAPWKDQSWSFWQYSQSGQSVGIKGLVDLDVFNGDADTLTSFIKSSNL
ncbi:MAG: glycoside hydrolase family 25 protein [Psychrosphaera sp.]|nr:glycoside hydrolase family 25 protein [Psychrosphaera sp.]